MSLSAHHFRTDMLFAFLFFCLRVSSNRFSRSRVTSRIEMAFLPRGLLSIFAQCTTLGKLDTLCVSTKCHQIRAVWVARIIILSNHGAIKVTISLQVEQKLNGCMLWSWKTQSRQGGQCVPLYSMKKKRMRANKREWWDGHRRFERKVKVRQNDRERSGCLLGEWMSPVTVSPGVACHPHFWITRHF